MPRPNLMQFTISPRALHEQIVMPQFGDTLDINGIVVSAEEGDWQIMDKVVHQRPVMDIFGRQNILKRRDATCKIIYSPVARLGARYISTEKLYAATEDCQEEFYQGAFQDFKHEDRQAIWDNVLPILDKAVGTDIFSNKWFGDVTRFSDPTETWSWNKFDGIFTWLGRYVADTTIPALQTFTIPAGTLTPTQANAALATAFSKQDGITKFYAKADKAFYVDEDLAESYYQYLIQSGQTVLSERMSGKPKLFFNGIEVRVKPWDGVLAALNGAVAAHAVILTVKGNFLYATDSDYGTGPNEDEAVRVWYSDDDMVWRRVISLKAGTQIAAPQLLVFGMTTF